MRISDWSSDVCSSDLALYQRGDAARRAEGRGEDRPRPRHGGRGDEAADRRRTGRGLAPGEDPRRARPNRLLRLERGQIGKHTSELQSLMRISYAVFCLKKKKQTTTTAAHQ